MKAASLSSGCPRMRRAFRDPAVWAWIAVGVLALLPLLR